MKQKLAYNLRRWADELDPKDKAKPKISKTTSNLYEAGFYLTKQAKIVSIHIKKNAENKIRKGQLARLAVIELNNVPPEAVGEWSTGTATVNLRDFENRRRKLKKEVDKVKYA